MMMPTMLMMLLMVMAVIMVMTMMVVALVVLVVLVVLVMMMPVCFRPARPRAAPPLPIGAATVMMVGVLVSSTN